MPYKNREDRLAAQRRWYKLNREKVIAQVKARKWEQYGGTCLNCGGPTIGESKGKAALYCSKSECAAINRSPWLRLIHEGRHVTHWKHQLTMSKRRGRWQGACSCGWISKRHTDPHTVESAYKEHTKLVERENKRPADGA